MAYSADDVFMKHQEALKASIAESQVNKSVDASNAIGAIGGLASLYRFLGKEIVANFWANAFNKLMDGNTVDVAIEGANKAADAFVARFKD